MIYVQHLLGVGHLQRSGILATALAQRGLRVALVSGGMPIPHMTATDYMLHQLAPVCSADASFSRLLDAEGNEIDNAWREARCQQLLDLFERGELFGAWFEAEHPASDVGGSPWTRTTCAISEEA